MRQISAKIIIAVVIVLALGGGITALALHSNNVKHDQAMMQAAAMKKADEAKAMKAKQATEDAAMKQSEANKMTESSTTSGDAMMMDSAH